MSESKTATRGTSHTTRRAPRNAPPQPKRVDGDGPAVGDEERSEEYAGAFARVRLVHAWVGAVAALVGLLMALVALVERLAQ